MRTRTSWSTWAWCALGPGLVAACLAPMLRAAPPEGPESLPAATPANAARQRPANILLILVDDLGIDMVEAYGVGHDTARMPVVSGLAREGVTFRNVWATPSCSATRASLLTGRHPFRHGLGLFIGRRSNDELPWDELIFPELLDQHPELGYSHGVVGKWHLGNFIDSPELAGFGSFTGTVANFGPRQGYYRWPRVECGVESISRTYATTATVDDALDFVASHPEPWFLYLPFNAVHAHFEPPPDHLHSRDLDPRARACDPRGAYLAMLEALDTELGRLLAGLGPRRARTHVLFLGDNGTPPEVLAPPVPPGHGKLSPYEGGLRVPLIVAGPAVREPGREVNALVGVTDLFATCAELAGLDLDHDLPDDLVLDSVSLLPHLLDPDAVPRRGILYSELFGPNLSTELRTVTRIVRNRRYKLIHRIRPADRHEFFDLDLDPHETTNLMGRRDWDAELWEEFVNLSSAIDESLQ